MPWPGSRVPPAGHLVPPSSASSPIYFLISQDDDSRVGFALGCASSLFCLVSFAFGVDALSRPPSHYKPDRKLNTHTHPIPLSLLISCPARQEEDDLPTIQPCGAGVLNVANLSRDYIIPYFIVLRLSLAHCVVFMFLFLVQNLCPF